MSFRVLKRELSGEHPREIAVEHYHSHPIDSFEMLTLFRPWTKQSRNKNLFDKEMAAS